ncbi:MAG TPA: putative sulfate exporter family transporter [Propionibacteriaceae bacterium]|nr:putative sulfate exporter family transporter [Propionibacteriaceae bacterium]
MPTETIAPQESDTGHCPSVPASPSRRHILPGLAVALVVAVLATLLGQWLPVIGGPVFGIVLGGLVGQLVLRRRAQERLARRLDPGLKFAARPLLQLAIVVLGTGLSLQQVARVGGSSFPVMVGTLVVALTGAALVGRLLGVESDARTLIGVGTGICGASAIAATTAAIRPRERDVAYAIGTIFTFNIAAVFLFPVAGHLMHLSGHSFGLWAGTAVNDTSSVVATAYSYGQGSGPYAIVVKLTRSLMIVPIVVALSILRNRRRTASGEAARVPWRRIVPGFILGFVAAAALNSLGLVPAGWHGGLGNTGAFLITAALAGIGLGLDLGEMRRAGVRPLLLGAILWVLVATSSLGLQALTGTLG